MFLRSGMASSAVHVRPAPIQRSVFPPMAPTVPRRKRKRRKRRWPALAVEVPILPVQTRPVQKSFVVRVPSSSGASSLTVLHPWSRIRRDVSWKACLSAYLKTYRATAVEDLGVAHAAFWKQRACLFLPHRDLWWIPRDERSAVTLVTALLTHLHTHTFVSPELDMRYLLRTLGSRSLVSREQVLVVTPMPMTDSISRLKRVALMMRNETRIRMFLSRYMVTSHAQQVVWWSREDRTHQWCLDSVETPVVWWHAGATDTALATRLRDTTYVVVLGSDGVPNATIKTILKWHRAVHRDDEEEDDEEDKESMEVTVDKTSARLYVFRGASFL